MQSRIVGTTMPVLEFTLDANESIVSEAGELSWMSSAIQLTTHTQMGGGGGFLGALKRVAGGGTLFMTEYRAVGASGELAFATKMPGHIVPVEIGAGREYMIQRHGFLCSTPRVQIGVGFQQSLGAGIFGGEGFLLQRLSGDGTAWLELSGELLTKDLQPGETLRVHPGHVGAFQASVAFQITTVPGIRKRSSAGTGSSSRPSPVPAASGCRPCQSRNSRTRSPNTCLARNASRAESSAASWDRSCADDSPGAR